MRFFSVWRVVPRGRLLRAPRYPRRQLFLHDGVGRDRQRTTVRGGPVLAMESLATSIACGWQRVEGWGVSIANDGTYMARRKIRIARGTGRHARSGFCRAIRGSAIMSSLLSHLRSRSKCKLQIQNCWVHHFVIFGKLQECKPQMQNCWRYKVTWEVEKKS